MPCQYATVWLTYKLASVTFQPQLVFEKVGEPISHDALCAKLPGVRCGPSAPGSTRHHRSVQDCRQTGSDRVSTGLPVNCPQALYPTERESSRNRLLSTRLLTGKS